MRFFIIKDAIAVLALFAILFAVASLDTRITPRGVVFTIGDYGYFFETEGIKQ